MEYGARMVMWLAGVGDHASPRKALREHERAYIERRVREELRGLDRKQFPKMHKTL
jgi:hypothetical protein